MKTRIISILTIILIAITIFNVSTNMCYAADISVKGMSEAERDFISTLVIIIKNEGEAGAVERIIIGWNTYHDNTTVVGVNKFIEEGYFKDYIDDFTNAGIPVTSSSNTPNNTPTTEQNKSNKKTKTEFTVEDVEPYTAWTTKNCNIRSGADTTYDKIGSLKKYEEVKVTGKASTGWYRITTSSGAEAYISNSLLTTDDPKKVTVQTVEKNGEVVTTTVEGENPLAVAQVVEEIKAEEASEEELKEEPKEEEPTYTSEITKEATCTEKGINTYTSEKGDSYTEEIPMQEHVPGDWEVSKEPSLTKAGEKVKKCTVCGEILETQEIPAKTNLLIGIISGCVVAIGGSFAGVVLYKKKH
ncbi:SH3 domain-containing protein [Butyrivibrio sp. AE2005]|uniref:SH3 domain-containing protein n=1 Tax=Butyrivibrio sp. AE2005 TaxID=1496722 RepID=UPI00047C6A5B|nr:SH3 domain-containing protein [Butyrivibrio sp. AE2005]